MPIRIISSQDNFRRCGIAHSVNPTEYPDDRFTEDELKELKAEPKLVVHIVKEAPALNVADLAARVRNAIETIALVKAATDLAVLDELAVGEERKSVIAAIAARRTELTPGAE